MVGLLVELVDVACDVWFKQDNDEANAL